MSARAAALRLVGDPALDELSVARDAAEQRVHKIRLDLVRALEAGVPLSDKTQSRRLRALREALAERALIAELERGVREHREHEQPGGGAP